MPLARIHVREGRYRKAQLIKLGDAIQAALEDVSGIPAEIYFPVYHVRPANRHVDAPGILGVTDSDDLILLEISFFAGRTRDARLTLLRAINERVVSAVGISPDHLAIVIHETAGENIAFSVVARSHDSTMTA